MDDNMRVSGYKRDLNNPVNNVWFEMSYAVAIGYYKLNSINKFNSIVTALNKFSNTDAGFTGTLVKDYANENMISYEAIGSTAWSLIGNNLSNLAFKIRTSLSPLSACTVPFYNDEQHQVFTKTGCTGTDTPTTYDYHVPQGRYMSYTSKDDANNIALNEISTFGQAYVNLYGQCVPAANVGNDVQSQDFTKNNCASGYHGSVVTMTVAANTYYASTKEDANILATNYILANGQNNANTYGTCIIDNSNNDVSVNYITATNQFQAFSSLPVNTDINIVYTIFDSTGANIANDGVTIYTGDTSSTQVDNVEAGNSPYHATIMSITPSSYNGMTYTF